MHDTNIEFEPVHCLWFHFHYPFRKLLHLRQLVSTYRYTPQFTCTLSCLEYSETFNIVSNLLLITYCYIYKLQVMFKKFSSFELKFSITKHINI